MESRKGSRHASRPFDQNNEVGKKALACDLIFELSEKEVVNFLLLMRFRPKYFSKNLFLPEHIKRYALGLSILILLPIVNGPVFADAYYDRGIKDI